MDGTWNLCKTIDVVNYYACALYLIVHFRIIYSLYIVVRGNLHEVVMLAYIKYVCDTCTEIELPRAQLASVRERIHGNR